MNTQLTIALINGPIASGKTSVAQSLARKWKKGVHLDVDIIRNFIKGGFIEEDELYEIGDSPHKRFPLKMLAIRLSVLLAMQYLKEGYSVFISDPIYIHELDVLYRQGFSQLQEVRIHYIYLQEDEGELLKRVRTRSTAESEPGSKVKRFFSFFEAFDKTNWTVVQTNSLSKEEVLQKVLRTINQS